MFRKLAGILAVCSAVCLCQERDGTRRAALIAEFQNSVMPVLSARCVGCHSAGQKIGNLNLEQFRDASLAARQPELWKKVRDRLTRGNDAASAGSRSLCHGDARRSSAGSIVLLGRAGSGAIDPGRVTARAPESNGIQQHDPRSARRHDPGGRRIPDRRFRLRVRQHRRRAFAIAAADGEVDVRRPADLAGGGVWRILPAAAEPAGEDQAEEEARTTARLPATSFRIRCAALSTASTIFRSTASMSSAGGIPTCAVPKFRSSRARRAVRRREKGLRAAGEAR